MSNTSPGYGITIRVDGRAEFQPVAEITTIISREGATITALDVAESSLDSVVIDVTCDAMDSNHAEKITAALAAASAAVIFSAWFESIASQVTSITTLSSEDSATSRAVMVAPSREMIVVISATGWNSARPSTRMVMPYPGEVFDIKRLRTDDLLHHLSQGRCSHAHLISRLERLSQSLLGNSNSQKRAPRPSLLRAQQSSRQR